MTRHFRFVLHNSELVTKTRVEIELPNLEYAQLDSIRNQSWTRQPYMIQVIAGLGATIRKLRLDDNMYGYDLHYLQRDRYSPYVAYNGIGYVTQADFEAS